MFRKFNIEEHTSSLTLPTQDIWLADLAYTFYIVQLRISKVHMAAQQFQINSVQLQFSPLTSPNSLRLHQYPNHPIEPSVVDCCIIGSVESNSIAVSPLKPNQSPLRTNLHQSYKFISSNKPIQIRYEPDLLQAKLSNRNVYSISLSLRIAYHMRGYINQNIIGK